MLLISHHYYRVQPQLNWWSSSRVLSLIYSTSINIASWKLIWSVEIQNDKDYLLQLGKFFASVYATQCRAVLEEPGLIDRLRVGRKLIMNYKTQWFRLKNTMLCSPSTTICVERVRIHFFVSFLKCGTLSYGGANQTQIVHSDLIFCRIWIAIGWIWNSESVQLQSRYELDR